MSASIKMLINLFILLMAAICVQTDVIPERLWQREDGQEASPAVLTEIITPLQIAGNHIYYGSLVMDLPEGVNVVCQDKKAGEQHVGIVADLEGLGDRPLAPRIWLTHYRMACEGEWAMANALLTLLPDTTLRFVYRNSDEKINLFRYTNGEKNGYILNREDDIYIVEELSDESCYGFGRLIDDKVICWNDGTEIGSRYNYTWITFFDRLCVGEETFLTVRYTQEDGRRWLALVREADLDRRCSGDEAIAYQRIGIPQIERASDEQITYRDYNFDGFLDIKVSPDVLYLWDPDEKKYKKA